MSSSELSNALNPYASQSRQRASNTTTSPIPQSSYTANSLQQSYNQQQLQPPHHPNILQQEQYTHNPLYNENQHFDQYQHNPQHVNQVNLQQQQQQRPQNLVASVNSIQPQQHPSNQHLPTIQSTQQVQSIPINQTQQVPLPPAPAIWQDNSPILQFIQEQQRNMQGLERRLQEAEERHEAEKRDTSKHMSEIQQLLKQNLEKFVQREEEYDKFKGQQIENDKQMQAFMQTISKKVETLESTSATATAELKAVVSMHAQSQARSMQYLQQSRQSLPRSPSMSSLVHQPAPLPAPLPAPSFTTPWAQPTTPQLNSAQPPSPFNYSYPHTFAHPSPATSSLNPTSPPTSIPSPYPSGTYYSPTPYPHNMHNNRPASVASVKDAPHSPSHASAVSPDASSAPERKRKRRVYLEGEDDSEDDMKPQRMNNHDKRVMRITKAMKLAIYELMDIVESEPLPPPPEEGFVDENEPIRFFWDKTVLKSAHNGRMRDRVVQYLQQNKDKYPEVAEKYFNTNGLKQTFDQMFNTLKQRYRTQTNPELQEKAVTKTRNARHTGRREEKLRRRAAARSRLCIYDHQIFESAMDLGCMSTEDSEEEVNPWTGAKVQILRTHPPAWRSKRLAKFYEKLDTNDEAYQRVSRKRNVARKPRKLGSPRDVPGALPPNGVSSWMLNQKWVEMQREKRQGFDAQLSDVVGEPVDGIPTDLPAFEELGNGSLTESDGVEQEEEEEEQASGSGQAEQQQQQTHEHDQIHPTSHQQQTTGPDPSQAQVQIAIDLPNMGNFMPIPGSYMAGQTQSVQSALHNGMHTNFNFPPDYFNGGSGTFF